MVFIQIVCLVIILLNVQKSYAAECPNVTINNECHFFDDNCYKDRRKDMNCTDGKVYHCGWNNSTKRFQEACAVPVTCDIGKEPWIIESANGVAKIECHYCHDQRYYNPFDRKNSNEYSHGMCEMKKDDCTSTDKFMCELNYETEKYTKNVRCRCDIRNGFLISQKYPETTLACSYDHGLSCMKTKNFSMEDILLIGYKHAPKCPSGYSRSKQTSDECFPVNTPTPSQTPRPVSPIPSSAASLPSVKTNQTTTATSTTTTTTTTTPSLTTTNGSPTTTSSQSPPNVIYVIGVVVGGIFVVLVLILILLGYIVWQRCGSRQRKRRNGGMCCLCIICGNRDINNQRNNSVSGAGQTTDGTLNEVVTVPLMREQIADNGPIPEVVPSTGIPLIPDATHTVAYASANRNTVNQTHVQAQTYRQIAQPHNQTAQPHNQTAQPHNGVPRQQVTQRVPTRETRYQPIPDKELREYSHSIGTNWELTSYSLGYVNHQVNSLKELYPLQAETRNYVMLKQWHDVVLRCKEDVRLLLAQTFVEERNNEAAEAVIGADKLLEIQQMGVANYQRSTKEAIKNISFEGRSSHEKSSINIGASGAVNVFPGSQIVLGGPVSIGSGGDNGHSDLSSCNEGLKQLQLFSDVNIGGQSAMNVYNARVETRPGVSFNIEQAQNVRGQREEVEPHENDQLIAADNGQREEVEPHENDQLIAADNDGIQPNPVQIFAHEDVPHDVKDSLYKKALTNCYEYLVEKLSPEELLDCLYTKGLFKKKLRDIRDENITSKKNRAIIKKIEESDWDDYLKFKTCLMEADQSAVVQCLQAMEVQLLEGEM